MKTDIQVTWGPLEMFITNPAILPSDPSTLRFSLLVRSVTAEIDLLTVPGFRLRDGKILIPARSAGPGKFSSVCYLNKLFYKEVERLITPWKAIFASVKFPDVVEAEELEAA